MGEVRQYLRWIAILCAAMAVFGTGVLAVGYQTASFGRVATIVCLLLAAAGLAVVSKRLGPRSR